MTPDSIFRRKLRRIDPHLSAVWVDPPGRWGIFHELQVNGNFDEQVDYYAREIQREASARGHVIDLPDASWVACEALKTEKLVCYVTEEDGSYRPLDNRILQKLERMKWFSENLGVNGWREMLAVKANALQRQREREQEGVWEDIKRDRAFQRMTSDILWGMDPVLSVQVKGIGHVEDDLERALRDAGGAGSRPSAVGDRAGRDAVAGADGVGPVKEADRSA